MTLAQRAYLTGLGIGLFLCAILLMHGCSADYLSGYQMDQALHACTDHGGRVIEVEHDLVRCDYQNKDAK